MTDRTLKFGLTSSDSSSSLATSEVTFSLYSMSVLEFDHQIHCEISELFFSSGRVQTGSR